MTLTRVRIHSDRYVEVLEKVTDAAGAKGWTLQVGESVATMKAPWRRWPHLDMRQNPSKIEP